MKAAIYSRFSTDKQTESSIADQVRVCTEYADKQGWTVAHRFEDQGISGAAIGNRPGCVAMLEAAKARAFDVLLVMDTSRLSRSSADLSKIADRLVFMGLRIVAVQEPGADTSKDGWELYFGLSGLMGQQFRKMTARKTHTALESRAKAGRSTGGRCFGYTSQNAIAEAEAPVVAEIFERRASGEGIRAIVKDLNARGVPTAHGRPWAVSGVHAMLRNERYIGRITWNRTAWTKDPDSGRRVRRVRPESELVTVIREDLRLVSEATWERVRARDVPATHSPNARLKHPLSGLLLCGECGKPMTLAGGVNSHGAGSRRYVCRTYKEHRNALGYGCSNDMGVSRAVAEELLIEPLRARLLADDGFLTALERLKASEPDPFALPLPAPAQEPQGTGPDDSQLAAKVAAIRAAEAAGAMSHRDAEAHCARLRAEHERAKAGTGPMDPAAIAANAEALRAALVDGAVDALRAALRRTLGTVRCRPVMDGSIRYLHADFEGGDMPLLAWLAISDNAQETGISALVAGARLWHCLLRLPR